jgi:Ca2+-binding EF-hand superfamily protein
VLDLGVRTNFLLKTARFMARLALTLLALALSLTHAKSILDDIPDVEDEDEDVAADGGYDKSQAAPTLQAHTDAGPDDLFEYIMGGGGGESSMQQLQALFEMLDKNKDGLVGAAEIQEGLELQLSQHAERLQAVHAEEARRILGDADVNGDGSLSAAEYADADLPRAAYELLSSDRFAFADAGTDEQLGPDGQLSVEELANALFPETSPKRAEFQKLVARRILAEHDLDGDGRLDRQGLMKFVLAVQGLGADETTEGESDAGVAQFAASEAESHLSVYDVDGDGTLDGAELGELLVPSPAGRDEYAREAHRSLLEIVPDGGGLDLESMLSHASRFYNAFNHLLEPVGYDESMFSNLGYQEGMYYDEVEEE